ncbi:protein L-Myc-1b isoform X2 [Nematostella vectensis]|nr:protein L-Myc-1b isoform X2 [Nematostella vectensis]
MFFDQTPHRGMMIQDGGPQDLVVEALSDDLCNPNMQNEVDFWKKFALPTPPYSPENYSNSCKRNVFPGQHQNTLQVVPDDFPEDLSSDLPLVLSDAEMERLTSSTFVNDCVWSEGDYDPHRMAGNLCAQTEPVREILPTLPEKQLRDFAQYTQSLAAQENTVCQQQAPHRWMPYTVESPSQHQQIQHPVRPAEDFAPQRYENVNSKRTRKPRRASRNSPQRPTETENEDSEDSEISRATHNVLERQRREDLKCRFQLLRDSIPELEDNERAPKVAILKKAREFVHQLIGEEERLCADKELERQRKLILLKRLHDLRNDCYGVL